MGIFIISGMVWVFSSKQRRSSPLFFFYVGGGDKLYIIHTWGSREPPIEGKKKKL